jgi:integrase
LSRAALGYLRATVAVVFLDQKGFSAVPQIPRFVADLKKAKIDPGRPEDGVVDFHALRATFATSLARAEVPLVVAQHLMRHADPKLTANVYTKLELHDKREAVERRLS